MLGVHRQDLFYFLQRTVERSLFFYFASMAPDGDGWKVLEMLGKHLMAEAGLWVADISALIQPRDMPDEEYIQLVLDLMNPDDIYFGPARKAYFMQVAVGLRSAVVSGHDFVVFVRNHALDDRFQKSSPSQHLVTMLKECRKAQR